MLSRFVLNCVVLHFFRRSVLAAYCMAGGEILRILLFYLFIYFGRKCEHRAKKLGKGRGHDEENFSVKMAAVTHISLESSKCSKFFVFRSVHVNELLFLFFIYFSFTSFCVVLCRFVAYFCALLHICSVFSSFSFAFSMYLSSFHSTFVIVSL